MNEAPTWDVRTADALVGLPFDDGVAHTCVTSPPYWGLRDYGVEGQLGLEPTPEEYVDKLVRVFRHVRRVLRDDGTLWVNLGDSYASTASGYGASGGSYESERKQWTSGAKRQRRCIPRGLKPKDLVGIPWMVAFALRQPFYTGRISDERLRYWMAGLVDGEGCMTILRTTSPHGSGDSYPPVMQVRMCDAAPVIRCAEITGLGKTSPRQDPPSCGGKRGSYQWRLSARNAADIARELYPYLLVKRRQAVVLWNHQLVRESYVTKRGQRIPRAAVKKQQALREIIQSLNAAKPVDIPSWLEEPPPMTERGWYLRSDCIWSKPNPMPESVTDRPTKAHEYIFMLSKSARYHYDADAIREAASADSGFAKQRAKGLDTWQYGRTAGGNTTNGVGGTFGDMTTRNKRSVWTVPTKPYKGAHFACFPPALIRPCILAGAPIGGTVLDPFNGSGTTGAEAVALGRHYLGTDLNPSYRPLHEERITAALERTGQATTDNVARKRVQLGLSGVA